LHIVSTSTAGITLADVERARARVYEVAVRTPLVRLFAPELPPEREIYLKLDCLQPIGSFKIRGAYNLIASLPPERLRAGVYTGSAGNAAQGVALAAARAGVPCTVIMPEGAPQVKLDAVRRLGARIIQVPWDDVWRCIQTRSFPGLEEATFIHPFDDPLFWAGNGTAGLEIVEDLPDVDTVVVPFGGGGLAIGVATAVKGLRPQARVLAAESINAPLAASLAAGRAVSIERRPSIADGIGGNSVLPSIFPHAQRLLDGTRQADEGEIRHAIRFLATRARVVAEGAGACPVAIALAGRAGEGKIVCLVSGGNIDPALLAEILAGR
jgi:threonine dehydratase